MEFLLHFLGEERHVIVYYSLFPLIFIQAAPLFHPINYRSFFWEKMWSSEATVTLQEKHGLNQTVSAHICHFIKTTIHNLFVSDIHIFHCLQIPANGLICVHS